MPGRLAFGQLLGREVVRWQDAGGAADQLNGDAQGAGDDGPVEARAAEPAWQQHLRRLVEQAAKASRGSAEGALRQRQGVAQVHGQQGHDLVPEENHPDGVDQSRHVADQG
jgi:hypothetical protein